MMFQSWEISFRTKSKFILTQVDAWDLCLQLKTINLWFQPKTFKIPIFHLKISRNMATFNIWMYNNKSLLLLLWTSHTWIQTIFNIPTVKYILRCCSVSVDQLFLFPTTTKQRKILFKVLCLNKLWVLMLWIHKLECKL